MIDIAFIIGNMDQEHGGAQQQLYDLCRNLPEERFNKTLFYLFGEGTFRPQLEKTGTTVIDLEAASNYDIRAYRRLVSWFEGESYDIIQTNSPISGVWGRSAGTLAQVPAIVSVEQNVHTGYRRFTRLINGVTLPLADAIVGVSSSVIDSFFDWERHLLRGRVEFHKIYNSVDIEEIESHFNHSGFPFSDYGLDVDDFVIGSVGTITKQKGYEYLIRAFPDILAEHPRAELLIIGDGPDRNELASLCRQLDIDNHVTFTGYLANVYPYLPALDAVVYPSLWEGFPLAVLQSMVARRPIVATDISPLKELLGDSATYVSTKDPKSIADSVNHLIRNEELRRELGQEAYKRVKNQFSIETTSQQYAILYESILTDKLDLDL